MYFERLKFIRESYDYTQQEIAEILNVKRGTYASWECGVDTIPLTKLILFSNYFSCRIDYLLNLIKNNDKNFKTIFDLSIISSRMKIIRQDLNFSLRKMAEELHINYSTLSKNESGKSFPNLYTIYELAKKFDYSVDWLTGRSENKYLDSSLEIQKS